MLFDSLSSLRFQCHAYTHTCRYTQEQEAHSFDSRLTAAPTFFFYRRNHHQTLFLSHLVFFVLLSLFSPCGCNSNYHPLTGESKRKAQTFCTEAEGRTERMIAMLMKEKVKGLKKKRIWVNDESEGSDAVRRDHLFSLFSPLSHPSIRLTHTLRWVSG